jgi:hypothetical protein
MERYRRTHRMASMLNRLESSQYLPVRTPKNLCVCSSCWQQRGTSPSHCGCLSDCWNYSSIFKQVQQSMKKGSD